jgi:hypothetical protein
MRLPGKKRSGNPILASDWNMLIDALEARTPRPGTGVELVAMTGGFTYRVRRIGSGGGSAGSAICPFGEIIDVDDETSFSKGIRGGVIFCGDKNFNVKYEGINTAPETNWETLIQIKIAGVEPVTDDDGEIYLPGISTAGSIPVWESRSVETGYDDNTNPPSPSATGTIIIPLGKLTVTAGVPSFEPTGCGNITIGQCAGILNFTRA